MSITSVAIGCIHSKTDTASIGISRDATPMTQYLQVADNAHPIMTKIHIFNFPIEAAAKCCGVHMTNDIKKIMRPIKEPNAILRNWPDLTEDNILNHIDREKTCMNAAIIENQIFHKSVNSFIHGVYHHKQIVPINTNINDIHWASLGHWCFKHNIHNGINV